MNTGNRAPAPALAAPLAAALLLGLGGCSYGTVGQSERAVAGAQRDAARYLDAARRPLAPDFGEHDGIPARLAPE